MERIKLNDFDEFIKFFENAPYDILNDPLEKLNYFCFSRLQAKFDLMGQEKLLCDKTGEGVVAEFGFKGPKEAVNTQLKELLEYRLENPYEDADRAELQLQMERFQAFQVQWRNNPVLVESRKLWDASIHYSAPRYEDIGLVLLLQDLSYEMNRLFLVEKAKHHESRLCVCFNNG